MKGELVEYTWRSICGFVVDTVPLHSSICGCIYRVGVQGDESWFKYMYMCLCMFFSHDR